MPPNPAGPEPAVHPTWSSVPGFEGWQILASSGGHGRGPTDAAAACAAGSGCAAASGSSAAASAGFSSSASASCCSSC